MSLATGDIIDGKYRIVRLLGEGGMGAVYEGENVRIHRKVAIKVLHAGVAENEDAVQRFEREAQAAGRIGSEHITEVLDLGNLPDGDRFMVMEYLEGDELSNRIRQKGKLTAEETYKIAYQILEGLKAAHGAGIIHRDLKPDNVYLLKAKRGTEDFVKILDFGISKFSALSGESGFSMTRTGAVMGTPYYMSPEQAKGAKGMDARADLYSVGVILYECLTGQVPFNADTFNELLFKIVLETPPPLEQLVPELDPNFSSLVTKSMAREPAHRFQSAQEFQDALTNWARTGLGTSVHPAAQAPGVRPPEPIASSGVKPNATTPGAWSQTGSGQVEAPKKSSGPVVAIAAVAAIAIIGGGGTFAALKAGVFDSETPAAQPDPEAERQRKELEEALRKTAEERKAAEEAAKTAKEENAAAKSALEAATEKEKRLAEERAAKEEEEKKKRELAARRAVPKKTPPPKKDPPKTTNTGKAGGRTIRTEL